MTSITRRSRLTAAIAAGVAAAAIVPAGAMASTSWFGSSLNHDPANAATPCDQNFDAPAPECTHIGSYYPGTSGRVKANANGTIVKIKVLAQGPMSMSFQLVHVRNLSADKTQGQAKIIKNGPTLNVTGPSQTQSDNGIYPVQSFRTHIRVHKGDELAITTDNNQAEYCSDGTPGQLTFFNPALSFGQGFQSNTGVDDCLLLVQAVIKH